MSDTDTTTKITSSQQRGMHALLRDHGITGDKAVHAYLDTWLAEQGLEPIESRADLPARVAAAIIRDLEDKAVLHAPGGLTRALVTIQKTLPVVAKTQTADVPMRGGGSYSYSYASLLDVTEAAMPLLAKNGLSFVTLPGGGVLTGMLLHSSGQTLTASLPIVGGTPQQVGSSLTYMRRYLLGCMTGLVTDDDEDGQLAQTAPRARAAKKSTAPPREDSARTEGGASEKQIKMLGALMGEAGLKDRDTALAYVADVIGHPVSSRNDLTSQEASKVIDALQRDLEQPFGGES